MVDNNGDDNDDDGDDAMMMTVGVAVRGRNNDAHWTRAQRSDHRTQDQPGRTPYHQCQCRRRHPALGFPVCSQRLLNHCNTRPCTNVDRKVTGLITIYTNAIECFFLLSFRQLAEVLKQEKVDTVESTADCDTLSCRLCNLRLNRRCLYTNTADNPWRLKGLRKRDGLVFYWL